MESSEVQALRKRMVALEQELARLEDMPDDVYDNGDVLLLERRFRTADRNTYTYVFLKASGMWYVTGRESNSVPWSFIAEILVSDKTESAWVATAWEELDV